MRTKQRDPFIDAADAFLLRVLLGNTNDAKTARMLCRVCWAVDRHTDQCFVPAMTVWATEYGH